MELLKGKYGYFADSGASYCIDNWKTPRPWANVVSNGKWGFVVSQAGGGYSWLEHSMLNRITRWNQDILKDSDGKFMIMRDDETMNCWSLAPQPLKPDYDSFLCKHGMGYTTFTTDFRGINSEWTMYVPLNKSCEVWKIKVKNNSNGVRKLTMIPYFELLLGVYPDWHREFQKLFLRSDYDESSNTLFVDNTLWSAPLPGDAGWNKDWPFRFFFHANTRPESYTCEKEEFFGRYADWQDAKAINENLAFSNQTGTGFDQVVAQRYPFNLQPGETKEFTFIAGVLARENFKTDFKEYVKLTKTGDKSLEEIKKHWAELCGCFKVETPEPAVNVLINYWLKYQAISCRLLGRTALYQCGGAFGFRDQLQDSQIWLTIAPDKTRNQILTHASHQQADGTVQHWWHPVSEEGRLTDISDDLLWLPFIVFNYINETGDYQILDEQVPYLDKDSGSIFEHCCAAIDRALNRLSPRGLSLIGEGDWNDGMNGVGTGWKGESIWLSHFLVGVLHKFACICQKIGNSNLEILYKEAGETLQKAVIKHGFENGHFIRATTDDGNLIGSETNSEGKIFLNAQTWAIINGIIQGPEAQQLMQVVENRLYRDYGILLFTPAYTYVDKKIGYLTRYPPGVRENGGVYTHAAIWTMWAQDRAGRKDMVYETFKRLCPPLLSNADPDKYMGEPYVTPGNIEGPESLYEGRGAWTWYSGSAAWLYQCTIENLLGIRVENDELVVKPNIPDDWDGFVAERLFRGKRMRITVKRSGASGSGSEFATTIEAI